MMRIGDNTVEQQAMTTWERTRSSTFGPRAWRLLALLLAMLTIPAPAGANAVQATPDDGSEPVVVTFASADGSTFRTEMEQPADIAAVRDALAGDGYAGIPNGTLAYGDGGINAPHDWHMEGTTLADFTIELCDGTATMVDEDVTYWVETVGQFCPWSATVVAVDPLSPPDDGDGEGGGDDDTSDLPNTGAGASGSGSQPVLLAAISGCALFLGLATLQWGRASTPRREQAGRR
jgi:hypothetical protein